MKKKTVSTAIATGLLLAPMALGLVANQAPTNVAHAATSTVTKSQSTNALADWTANTPSHIKAQIQAQAIDPANAKNAVYTIQWGDTLWGISQATGISIDQLATDNHIANRDLIIAGAKLTLNGSAKAQAFVQNAQGQSADSKASVSGANSAAAGTTGAATGTASNKAGTDTTPSGTEASGSSVKGSNASTGAGTSEGGTSSAVTPSKPSTGSGDDTSTVNPSKPSTGAGSSSSSSNDGSSTSKPSTPSTSSGSQGSGSSSSGSDASKPSEPSQPSKPSEPSKPSTGSGDDGSTTPSKPVTPTAEYADVTVKAVTSDGTVLKTATISHQEVGKSVTAQASSVAISGYDLSDTSSKSATVAKSGTVITFTFKKHVVPAGNTYTPNVDHIKQLVMAKYNLASHGKYWGKPVGKAGDNGSIVGADGHLYLATPETWPLDNNPYTSDEQIAEAIWETRVTQALDDPNNVSAVIDTLTATGSTTINPNGTVSGKIQTYMHMTWYQKF
ncbi:LysM peptidoglycan-binding domain-containing protein [Lacticaseibacillus paracasei]|uniref:LysM peptidoglycan-binding domain-containing protein n=1 Tax=Lacticaseibacillus paracasei TaxID=1597 RepID=UPI0021C2CE6B|nr:LysM domain-containing protein [Lacticaseibacillus paracasei]MCP9309821.1 LysM peptidoglycan-binding domain-containing protein [Lacticaseibacillus paracasei]MCP9346557.1 LysM peptidoglycan-binding domain-containing protein [Lacticaseibacillus paracasei]MCP9366167.1 LysM peptidoglycan-binding domain-containing protein [Lacticaseibacillus paracasei]MCP9378537.1 LysM peptidoglycan-binding domain-containing protein [Lacticaseibacillus paracasei]